MGYKSFHTRKPLTYLKVYHSLARANFSAERGIRYGLDFYDERMQATKVLDIEISEDGLPSLALVDLNTAASEAATTKGTETEDIAEKLEQTKLEADEQGGANNTPDGDHDFEDKSTSEQPEPPKSKDPLRWFGILSPPALRQAQRSASKLVEIAVKLSSIDAEMKGVEIEIRRARKKKTKSEKPALGKTEMGREARDSEVKQQERAQPVMANRGGGCGRIAI